MSIPNPSELPDAFLEHLKSLDLDLAVTTFTHFTTRPVVPPGGRYDGVSTQEWCERMDTLLGKFIRVMSSQPAHKDLVTVVTQLCSDSITECEAGLKAQIESDQAAREEEARAKVESARLALEATRLAAERAEAERRDRMRKMEEDRIAIDAAERELAAKKRAWADAHGVPNGGNGGNDDDEGEEEDEEDGDESAADQGTGKKRKHEIERETRSKQPQETYDVRCELCARTNEQICRGPIGQACNVCWQQKKKCSNSRRRRPREIKIKEEPKSPKNPTKKQRVYAVSNANSIGIMDVHDVDAEPAQPPTKRRKTAVGSSSRVRFDGVEVHDQSNPTPKAPRRSTRSAKANSKKDVGDLFGQLAKDFQMIAKTCEEIAEAYE